MKLYKDLGKSAKKILSDDFDCNTKSVELKTKTSNGVSYTTSGQLSDKGEKMNGDLQMKYKISSASMTTKMTTSGGVSQEVVLDNVGTKGLKVTTLGSLGKKQSMKISGEYVNPHASINVQADVIGKPCALTSMAVGTKGIAIGGQLKYTMEDKKAEVINGVINYAPTKDNEVNITVMDKLKAMKLSYFHAVSKDFSVAGEFAYEKRDEGNDMKMLTAATKYCVDAETTIKTKVNSFGDLWLSYSQEIRKNTTLTLSTKLNVQQNTPDSQSVGIALVIE